MITVYRNRRGGVPKKDLGPYIVIKDGRVHMAMNADAKKALQTEMADSYQKRMSKLIDKIMKKEGET